MHDFVQRTEQKERGEGLFELESDRLLEVNLSGRVWFKMGAMIAYRGDIRFTRERLLEFGFGKLVKRSLTGEGTQLSKAEGTGSLYLADGGKKITILDLADQGLLVNGSGLLAFEDTIQWDVVVVKGLTGMMAGGLFNVRLSGHGMAAITTYFDPLTLRVTPSDPVMTDPAATVAWSAGLTPELKADVSVRTFLGRGSGDSLQMCFRGEGFVVVQPVEEFNLGNEAT
ncbi:MAG: AIM24 family protein [Verrucomicrobiia bacterium]